MAYMEQLLAGLKYLTAAGETGRRSLDGMLGPVNGAINEITGAASELDDLPFIGPAVGAKVQRLMRGVSAAQAKAGAVVATYNKATRAASQIDERLGVLKEQTGKAATALNKIAGNVSPSLANIIPTGAFGADATPAAEAVKPFPHLLIMQSLKPGSTALGTITLIRADVSRWQFRLTDRTSHKAVSTQHQDKKTGQLKVVTLDNEESPDGLPPVHTDRHIYPNKSAAEQAAKARLSAFNRSTAAVRLEMPGRTDLYAERTINAQGFKSGLDGEYLVDSVEQVFTQSGWSTTVECNGGKKGKAKAKGKKPKAPLKVVSLKAE